MNDSDQLSGYFNQLLKKDKNQSPAVAAISTLLEFIRLNTFGTVSELRAEVVKAIDCLTKTDSSAISVKSGCEILLRFTTLTGLEPERLSMNECKEVILSRGKNFLDRAYEARSKIARTAYQWIKPGASILTHSKSRVVLQILIEAYKKNGNFNVYVCESRPDNCGIAMVNDLKKEGINVTSILDASVGAVMEKVDFVLLGAEGVVENGGIINKIGTTTISLCAKMLNKPVYVAVESFKFVRFYPLNNRDIPDDFKYKHSTIASGNDLSHEHPLTDYTQPSLLTLLFTDLGILTPSAVSDQLVQLYT